MPGDGGRHEVVVRLASFHYLTPGSPRRQVAERGDTIEVNDADYAFGQRHGAFQPDGVPLVQEHGTLPAVPSDEDDKGEIEQWMRSASVSDVASALEAAAAEGIDVAGLLLAGELSRGSEAREDVIDLITAAQAESPADVTIIFSDPDGVDSDGDSDGDPDGDPDGEDDGEDDGESGSDDGEPNGDDLPDGTVDEVKAWVGEDRARASIALGAELERTEPRSTLTAFLEKLVDSPR